MLNLPYHTRRQLGETSTSSLKMKIKMVVSYMLKLAFQALFISLMHLVHRRIDVVCLVLGTVHSVLEE